MQRILRPLMALFLMLLPSFALAKVEIPRLNQAVMDEAKIVSGPVKSYLNTELLRLHQSGGSQIAVLIIPSLEGEEIAAFSIRAADAWKLGSESKDNGVLLVIAVKERKLRIEVGQGNEGVLTDLQASRIIDSQITPYFKQGDFDSGVKVGVLAIAGLTNPEFAFQNSEPVRTVKRHKAGSLSPIVFFIILILVIILSNKGGRGGSDGLVGFLAGFVLGGGLGGRSGGGFGGSDGGGFSGGGGGFSGGGASGEW